MCVNWFTTGVIASWWSPLLFSWAISCLVTKVETSGIWVVLEFGEPLLCPFLGDTILVTILVDLLILELDWESTWRFEVWARRFLSRFLVFCGGKNWIVNLLFQMREIAFIPTHHLGINYYVNFLERLGSNGFQLKRRFGNHDNWKNQNPGGHLGATS